MRTTIVKYLSFSLILISAVAVHGQQPTDCINALGVCSNGVINENSNGPGINDFAPGANGQGCLGGGEHQSVWLFIQIFSGNNLGFDITPVGGFGQDYDFAVFGPNVGCGNLGSPIRCSWADGFCAYCPSTGLNQASGDYSEGALGNGYVHWLNVSPGQTYYILVDNYNASSSGFMMNWTGDASLDCSVTLPCPVFELGDNVAICQGSSTTIGIPHNPLQTYLWNTGETSSEIVVSSPGTYWLAVTKNGCTETDTIEVLSESPIDVDFGADTTLCQGEILILDATNVNATNYLWQNGSTNSTLNVTSSGTYLGLAYNGTCWDIDTIDVAFDAVPVFELGPDISICEGEDLQLDASSPLALTYAWQDGSVNSTINVDQSGIYSATASNNGCTYSDQVSVDIVPFERPFLGNDTMLCSGQTFILDAASPSATSYTWQDGSTGSTYPVTITGLYWVDVANNQCVVRDSIIINVYPMPVFDLGPDRSICEGESILLDASTTPTSEYFWQDGSTGPTFLAEQTGMYAAVATNPACAYTDHVFIEVHAYPELDLGSDTALCEGETLVLDASSSGASFYQWQDGSTAPSINIQQPGTYSLIASNGQCAASDTIEVDFLPQPVFELGDDRLACEDELVILNALSVYATEYLWQDGSTGAEFEVTTTGSYSVTASNGACSYSDQVDVEILEYPRIDLGPDTALCEGEVLILDASLANAWAYLWQDGSTLSTYSATESGTYSLIASNDICISIDEVTVLFHKVPEFELGMDSAQQQVPVLFCEGDQFTLSAYSPHAAGYLWQDGSTDVTFVADQTGQYHVTAFNNSCHYSDTVVLTFNPSPHVDLGNDTSLCEGSEFSLNATSAIATGYIWQDGFSGPVYPVQQSGTYEVMVVANNCFATDLVEIEVLPAPVFELGSDTSLCSGQTILLSAYSQSAFGFEWQDGSTSASYLVSDPGTYSVTAFNNACTYNDEIQIAVLDYPQIDLGDDQRHCDGASVVLDAADIHATTYLWNDGNTQAQITAYASGTYGVSVANQHCVVEDQVSIEFLPYPSFELGSDTALCEGIAISLNAYADQATDYLWQDGTSSPSIIVDQAGNYTVTVSNEMCSISDQIWIEYAAAPNFSLGQDATICAGEDYLLHAPQIEGATYYWQDNSSTPTFLVRGDGVFTLTVETACGIATDDIEIIRENCDCNVLFPTGFTPNGDGHNDSFYPFVLCDELVEFEMEIYNRWGELLFQTDDVKSEWLQSGSGADILEMDTYIWTVKYSWIRDGEQFSKAESGSVLLLK